MVNENINIKKSMKFPSLLNIGTCSWKYDSWIGLIYSADAKKNYLKEYARHYKSVEIDQWFWSLFPGSAVKLPDPKVVQGYAESVPDDFTFCVKVPNSITLTHYYTRGKNTPPQENPYFFSNAIFELFLEQLKPMQEKLGPLIFQFEYLNKQKMPDYNIFLDKLNTFIAKCPPDFKYAIEIRNPNYLNNDYFQFLSTHNLNHVFVQGYFMPSIVDVFKKSQNYTTALSVIRLLGPDRKDIEQKTKEQWNEIVVNKDGELDSIYEMIKALLEKEVEVYVNVNNHYEGSAPKTIDKILTNLSLNG